MRCRRMRMFSIRNVIAHHFVSPFSLRVLAVPRIAAIIVVKLVKITFLSRENGRNIIRRVSVIILHNIHYKIHAIFTYVFERACLENILISCGYLKIDKRSRTLRCRKCDGRHPGARKVAAGYIALVPFYRRRICGAFRKRSRPDAPTGTKSLVAQRRADRSYTALLLPGRWRV